MVAGFTTTYAISVYHDFSCEFESCSWPDVFDTTLYDKVCKLLAAGRWEISWGVSLINIFIGSIHQLLNSIKITIQDLNML
jgi:hypothetical protein